MRMIEWAFEQNLPTAEKLVLVYLATQAGSEGVGLMEREQLCIATGYKKRSMQRLLKALRDLQLLIDVGGHWYRVGPLAPSLDGPSAKLLAEQIAELPEDIRPLEPVTISEYYGHPMSLAEIAIDEGGPGFVADTIAQAVGDYVIDQFANFEQRIMQALERRATFHVEPEPEPEPPDPVITNPLFQELIDLGKSTAQAYALSKADLAMDEDRAEEMPLAVDDQDDGYSEDPIGRRARIADILHGSEAHTHNDDQARRMWNELEIAENKHTVKGEPDAFELIYPAIVAAAKANVGKITLLEFINPARVKDGNAPWDREINPIDKEDPVLGGEISAMLAELEEANDPRCQVQPRTKETGDDGEVRTETLLGFHRRVSAKYREMQKLRAMGVI